MRAAPERRRRRLVDRRAHERVPEADPAVRDLDQAELLRAPPRPSPGSPGARRRPAPSRGRPSRRPPPGGAAPGPARTPPRPRARTRARRGWRSGPAPSTASSLSTSRPSSAIGERQPLGPAEDLLGARSAATAAVSLAASSARRLAVERLDRQILEPRGVERRLWLVTRGQDHPDRRAGEPATREQQRVERRRVQPVRVVDAHEHRPLSRRAASKSASVAAPTRKRSRSRRARGRAPRRAPSRCGPGSSGRRSSTGRSTSSTPANATSASPGMPLARSTMRSAAASTAKSSSADFPTPATPRSTSAAPPPARVAPISDSSRAQLRVPTQEHAASVTPPADARGRNVGSSSTRAGPRRTYGRRMSQAAITAAHVALRQRRNRLLTVTARRRRRRRRRLRRFLRPSGPRPAG